MIPHLEIPRKYKLIYSERKQVSGYLRTERVQVGAGVKDNKGTQENLRGEIHYLDCGDGFRDVYRSKLIKLYRLKCVRLMNINYKVRKNPHTHKSMGQVLSPLHTTR